MGFSITYQSPRPVTAEEAGAITEAARAAIQGRTWLRCEPVHFYPVEDGGILIGSSKPNFTPHPDDAAAAEREGLPDGTCRDLIDVLCRLSRDHGVDWALGHDHDPDIGAIRAGVCDPGAYEQVEALAALAEAFGEMDRDGE